MLIDREIVTGLNFARDLIIIVIHVIICFTPSCFVYVSSLIKAGKQNLCVSSFHKVNYIYQSSICSFSPSLNTFRLKTWYSPHLFSLFFFILLNEILNIIFVSSNIFNRPWHEFFPSGRCFDRRGDCCPLSHCRRVGCCFGCC